MTLSEYNKKYYNLNREKILLERSNYVKKNKDFLNKSRREKDLGLFTVWRGIISRCRYNWSHNYKNYGGRGIRVEWNTYQEFKNDMIYSYSEHLKKYGKRQTSLDRIDNNGNYCKKNCRWATYKEQCSNRRKNIIEN